MNRFATALLLSIGVTAAGSAAAGDWYFGLSAGQARADVSNEQMIAVGGAAMWPGGINSVSSESSSLDASDFSWSVFGGFRFTKNFALEVSYVDLGRTSYQRQITGIWIHGVTIPPPASFPLVSGTGEVTLDSAGLAVKALVAAPLGERFDVHANLGVFAYKTDMHASGSVTTGGISRFDRSADDDSQALSIGVGFGYRFYGPWTVNLDWQRYMDVGIDNKALEEAALSYPEKDFEADRDAVTLSLLLSF